MKERRKARRTPNPELRTKNQELRIMNQELKTKNTHPLLAMAILLHDIGKPKTRTVKERIRFDGHLQLGAKMAERILKKLSPDLLLLQLWDMLTTVRHPCSII
jgi:putative nucleotidyltransferase with HDIG domain